MPDRESVLGAWDQRCMTHRQAEEDWTFEGGVATHKTTGEAARVIQWHWHPKLGPMPLLPVMLNAAGFMVILRNQDDLEVLDARP